MPQYRSCNLCGSSEYKLIENAQPPFMVVRCKVCGLIYVNPQPEASDLLASYAQDYYAEWITKQEKPRTRLWAKRLRDVEKHQNKGKLLDVGCGLGAFLGLARAQGWQVWGNEISEFACSFAKQKLNLDIFKGQLCTAPFEADFFDCVTFWHSLEHAPEPLAQLQQARKLLKNDGILVVEVPNVNDYLSKIIYRLVKKAPERLFSIYAKELHLFHFSRVTLKMMVEKAGFKVLKTTLAISQIPWPQRLIDSAAITIFWLSRVNIGSSIRIYARKNSS